MNIETQEGYPGIAHDFEQCKRQLSDALAANELLIAENRRLREDKKALVIAMQFAIPALEYVRKQFPRSEHDDSIDVLLHVYECLKKHGSQS